MPSRPARSARSSSRSSRTADPAATDRGRPVPPDARSAPGDPETVVVAVVAGAHGLRGLLRVRPFQWPAPSLTPDAVIILEHGREHGRTSRAVRIRSVAPHGGDVLLVALDGVDERSAAEALRGARVRVRVADLPPCAADEFYWHEVLGFAVETVAGLPLGVVTETLATGLNDVWVVRDGAREVLIPVIADVVRTIDRAARRIVIEPLAGLLE